MENKLFVNIRNFNGAYPYNYISNEKVVLRGKSSPVWMNNFNIGRPPAEWFRRPKRAAELVLAVGDIKVEGRTVHLIKIISSKYESGAYEESIDLDRYLRLRAKDIIWIT